MSEWTKDSAIAELDRLASATEGLRGEQPFSADHTRWLVGTQRFLAEVFGLNSPYYQSIVSLSWRHRGTMLVTIDEAFNPGSTEDRYDRPAFARALEAARGILLAARDELTRSSIDGVYQGKDTGPEASKLIKIITSVERKLRKLFRDQPTKEKVVQDALESLFIGADVPYSRETASIEYSTKTYTPDFTVPKADLAIEVKLCSRPDREKELIAEINDDILAYRQAFGNLFFIVYDCGFIRDSDRFTQQFEETPSVIVRVIKH
jgi:REase_DpnII-MboI